MIVPSGPGIPENYGSIIDQYANRLGDSCEIQVVCPYVTSSGLSELWSDSSASWHEEQESNWIIGLDQGITDPDALRRLLHDENMVEPYVFLPNQTINSYELYSTPKLHAKGFILTNGESQSVVLGSANITSAALSSTPDNYELGHAADTLSERDTDKLRVWLDALEEKSVRLDASIIDEYESVRSESFSGSTDSEEATPPAPIERAQCLWIYTSRLSSGSRHQLDLERGLAAFFSVDTDDYSVSIEISGETYETNEVAYRPDRHQVPMWRLHLPTRSDEFGPHEEDNEYWCDKYVRFEKILGEDQSYRIHVEESDNSTVEEWRMRSDEFGSHSSTGTVGGRGQEREYGFY